MEEIIKLLQKSFPQLVIESISNLGSGNDSNAYLINDKIVFKIPKHQKASDNLKKEKFILDFLTNKTTFAIPRVEYSAVLSNSFLVVGYSKVNGSNLTKELFDTLTDKEQDSIAKQIAQFLNELHKLDVANDDLFVDKKKQIETAYVNFICKFSKCLTLEQLERSKNFFEGIINESTLYDYKPALVHNDFSAGNILYNDETKSIGIIDFGDTSITDRDNDFLCLLEDSDEEYGRDFGVRILKYYGCSDKEIELAIKKAKINDSFWPYEEMLLSEEYNDENMFKDGLKKIQKKFDY